MAPGQFLGLTMGSSFDAHVGLYIYMKSCLRSSLELQRSIFDMTMKTLKHGPISTKVDTKINGIQDCYN